MRNKIINYLVRSLLGSMLLYFVNGSPEKRLFRIKELANHIYNKMSSQEKKDTLNKIKSDIKQKFKGQIQLLIALFLLKFLSDSNHKMSIFCVAH